MSKITWQNLYKKVDDCHQTIKFDSFSRMDSCIKDSQLLLEYTPDTNEYYNLKEGISLTKDRITTQKGIHLREKTKNFDKITEEAILKERLAFRLNRTYEKEKWATYKAEVLYRKENPIENQVSSTGINWYSISMVLVFFFIIFVSNLFLSGKWDKRRLMFKLNILGLKEFSDLIQKDLFLGDLYDKKKSLKKGEISDLTVEEKIFLEKIYINEKIIDVAYELKKQASKNIDGQEDDIDDQINNLIEKFRKEVMK